MNTTETTETKTYPTSIFGGTRHDDLIERMNNLRGSLRETLDVLCATAPHARDYLAPGEFEKARSEHNARVRAIETMIAETLAYVKAVRQLGRKF